MSPSSSSSAPVLVVGAGLAGLSAALAAAAAGADVQVLSPAAAPAGTASAWAQGGLAAAVGPDDSPALHAEDTRRAGAGLVDPAAALALAEAGPAAVARLSALGAPFDRDADGRLSPSLEAAHGRARVVRVGGDGAGAAIMAAMLAAARREPRIRLLEGVEARRILTDASGRAAGVMAVADGAARLLPARAVILATGGLGGLFAVTTNPPEAQGLGLALGLLAGAVARDPEFVQFHPTALNVGEDPAPLATEALRGEGALLVNRRGERFMAALHPRAELAPRDVVARGLQRELAAGRGAFLDARAAVGEAFAARFPAVFAACRRAGVDPRRDLIPVAPAAHYHMGGIEADLAGRTRVPGLLAAGECASSGVHGANRLASNSLLEAAVVGAAAGRAAVALPPAGRPRAAAPFERLDAARRGRLRAALSRWAGVERDGPGLLALRAEIGRLRAEAPRALEPVAAALIAEGALARRESRGAHARTDFPAALPEARSTRLEAGGDGAVRALLAPALSA